MKVVRSFREQHLIGKDTSNEAVLREGFKPELYNPRLEKIALQLELQIDCFRTLVANEYHSKHQPSVRDKFTHLKDSVTE